MVGLDLSLTALDFGGSCNLVLRRHGVGGGPPAQGRRHDWVEAKNPWGLGDPLGIASVRDPSAPVPRALGMHLSTAWRGLAASPVAR